MSYSKPLPPFVCDSLYYLNRDQLERFSIVCRSLKSFIDRYLKSKPYRVFDKLVIRRGSYALFHNWVQWHPNREDYSASQFLASQRCNIGERYYSYVKMHPYLCSTVRIKTMSIYLVRGFTYSAEEIAEMESISYLWRDGDVRIIWNMDSSNARVEDNRIVAEYFEPILNSPTILQCQTLFMDRADFSFKDYAVLYSVKVFKINCAKNFDHNYWLQFLEHPGVKPVVVLHNFRRENAVKLVDLFSKAFSSVVLPNAFKIVFERNNVQCYEEPMSKFQKTNKTSGEFLELKADLPMECQRCNLNHYNKYILERYSI